MTFIYISQAVRIKFIGSSSRSHEENVPFSAMEVRYVVTGNVYVLFFNRHSVAPNVLQQLHNCKRHNYKLVVYAVYCAKAVGSTSGEAFYFRRLPNPLRYFAVKCGEKTAIVNYRPVCHPCVLEDSAVNSQ